MGAVIVFDQSRRRAPLPLPVALTAAWVAYCQACAEAWWIWGLTGR